MADKDTKAKATAKATTTKSATTKPNAAKKTTAAKNTAMKPAAAGKTSAKKTSTTAKSAPAAKTTVVTKSAPAAKATTSTKSAPAAKTTAATKSVPATKSASAAKPAPAAKNAAPTKAASVKGEKKAQKEKKPKRIQIVEEEDDEVTAIDSKKLRLIILSAVSVLLLISLILGIVFGVRGCSKSSNVYAYDYAKYPTNTAVGYYGEELGTVKRNKPVKEIKDEGLPAYPKYGYTLKEVIGTEEDKVAARTAIIQESSLLAAFKTSGANNGGSVKETDYTWMDKKGMLWQGTVAEPVPALLNGKQRQLYQHTASVGLYLGDVSDKEPGIIKQVTMRPRNYNSGYSITGVYAPAGEVIKIEISEADMEATGGIIIHIGQALYNGQANNIWVGKNQMQRIPHLLNTMYVTKDTATFDEKTRTYTAYVGSFLGGPIYIRNESVTFTTTISGGVAYQHFILGYTTEAEFEKNAKSSAPYFDLEVWDRGVLHSGPLRYAKNFSYEDLYNAAVLWDKVASVTTRDSSQGIVFLYDPFVAAGGAVAFPGRMSVNCPMDWMASSLNYNGIVTSGSWGNFHEYHHNFQGYGVGNGGEVTNNGLTLVSYALFTKISSSRGISNYGAQGLGTGWNRYTSATWTLEETLKIPRGESPSNGNQGLALYATLLHNFGADAYINARKVQTGGQSYQTYMDAWENVTHNDMSYYFHDILGGNITPNEKGYPVFVPVSSVYQTGRSYLCDGEKRYFQTMQPYVIPYGEAFDVDLTEYSAPDGQYASGSIVIPDGFTYRIKNVTLPEHGSLVKVDDFHYRYVPDTKDKSMTSGQIKVTLEITKDDGAFEVDDVDLVLQFDFSHESKKMTLEKTTYTFSADNMYTDATQAFENGFKGYASVTTGDHSNPVQNANTDIWYYPNTDAKHQELPNAPEAFFAHDNTIDVINGKLYFGEDGKYRIFLRGRQNCAVYFSPDGNTYTLGAKINDTNNTAAFRPTDSNTYFDVEFKEGKCTVFVYVNGGKTLEYTTKNGENWIYVKEILIVKNLNASQTSYIGLGMKQWTEPLFTTVEKYYDKNGKEVPADSAEIASSKTFYYDANGKEVSEKDVASAELIPPASASYTNAYRATYEFPDNKTFQTDYFYTRDYNYNYKDNYLANQNQTLVSTNYVSGISWSWTNFPPENLVDGNKDTFIHTNNWGVSPDKPLEIVMDMGEAQTINRMTIYSQNRPNGDWQIPKDFTLEGSLDGETFFTVGTFENVPRSGVTVTVNFEEKTFRFYRLVITGSHSSHIIIGEIEMWHFFELMGNGNNVINPTSGNVTLSGKWKAVNELSTFGNAYVGSKGSKINFTFTGTRLAILTPVGTRFKENFDVYIDGKKVLSIDVAENKNGFGVTYLSEKLASGTHNVEIKCRGEAAFDSFATYNEA